MVSQNGRGLEWKERKGVVSIAVAGINDRTYCSLPQQPPLYRWRDLCQVYRRTRPFLFDRDNVDVAASLFPRTDDSVADRELSRVIEQLPPPPIFSSSFSHVGDFRAKEELDARPMSRFVVPGTPPSPHDNCFVETSSFFSRPPLPFSSPIN